MLTQREAIEVSARLRDDQLPACVMVLACLLGQRRHGGLRHATILVRRAENSNTTRHLAEFWMIEPELAYADLEDDMNCAEDYVRYCCKYLLETCP